MFVTPLNTRRKKIFQAIVEAYIETAAPVSSQAIAQRLRWRISTATVRNVMAQLGELGLIWQPHTSAGRIPTDLGYRYYIDSLLEVGQLTPQEQDLITSRYPEQNEALDELLGQILRLLSEFSGYTAIAFSSGLRRILFRRLELVSVHSTKILLALVSLEGQVKTTIIQMPYKVEQEELLKIARFLSEEFAGLALDEIKQRIAQRILLGSDSFFHLLTKAAQILDLAWASFAKDRLYLEGASCILGQPEFQDAHKLQAVLRTLERQETLLQIMKGDLDTDGVRVHIGRENPEDIQECSLVISNFKIKNKNMGALGIIGPQRMPYARAISAVGYVAQTLGQRISEFYF